MMMPEIMAKIPGFSFSFVFASVVNICSFQVVFDFWVNKKPIANGPEANAIGLLLTGFVTLQCVFQIIVCLYSLRCLLWRRG